MCSEYSFQSVIKSLKRDWACGDHGTWDFVRRGVFLPCNCGDVHQRMALSVLDTFPVLIDFADPTAVSIHQMGNHCECTRSILATNGQKCVQLLTPWPRPDQTAGKLYRSRHYPIH